MVGGGSSSESTSYGYLPYISPQAAAQIGQYQSQAAQEAANVAKSSTNSAIAAITKNYTDARSTLQPYVGQGVQATNELNRYLGLDPYNPGSKAPTAPVDPSTWNPSAQDIKDYVKANSYISQVGKNPTATGDASDPRFYTVYNGEGAAYDGWSKFGNFGQNDPESGLNIIGQNGQGDITDAQKALVTSYLKNQYAEQNKDLYAAKQSQYDLDLQNYNQNKAWYDEYSQKGAYTADEIQHTVESQPGYQAQMDQGTDAIQRAASARGLLGSGNMLKDLSSFGSQLAGQYYNTVLDRLAQQAGVGANAAGQVSSGQQNQGNAIGQLYSQLGDSLGNAALARGQAMANSTQLANQQYQKVISGQSSSSSGGGLSGLGSIIGAGSQIAGMFSSKTYKTKGKKTNLDLEALEELPVEKWKYKKNLKIDNGQEHIGPYAEDFKKVFGVGDGKTIPIVSAVGILYGLVKELNKKLEDK